MWLLSVLAFTYRVIIGRYIIAPGYGRIKIDGSNGYGKTYLEQNKLYCRH